MKNLLLVAAILLLFSSISKAETFNCVFTEPFVSFSYNTKTEKMVESEYGEKKRTIKKVSFEINEDGAFVLKTSKGKVLATLTHDKSGSDGMSDIIYPFSAEYSLNEGKLYGGCESSKLKRTGEG